MSWAELITSCVLNSTHTHSLFFEQFFFFVLINIGNRFPRNPLFARRVDPSAFAFSLSLARNEGMLHFRRAAFYSQFKSKVGKIISKATAMRVNLNIDVASIASRSHSPVTLYYLSSLNLFLGIPFVILFSPLRYPLPQFHPVCARFLDPPVLDFSLS